MLAPYWQSDRGRIYKARAENVYPLLEPGSVSLLVSDGPYAMGKAEWDKQGLDGLPDWYAPHIEAWGKVCAPSATVYLWNTAAGWARLDPVMRAAGWTFRSLVTWDKGIGFMAGKCDVEGLRTWYDVTEVCGMYQREAWDPSAAKAALVRAGRRGSDVDIVMGTACMASRKWLGTDAQAQAPTADDLRKVRRRLPGLGGPWMLTDPRPPFDCPLGVGNVWRHGQVTGAERLRGADGASLHPCQKPLAFSRRIIHASARPGELVLEPFGGTCRVAAAMEEAFPGDVRPYICVEPDEDGRDYLPAVVADIERRQQAMALTRRMGPVNVEPVSGEQQAMFSAS